MKDEDLGKMLHGMARHHVSINWQENKALREAARRLMELGAPARPLSYKEIQRLPEFSVIWEEWRCLPEEGRPGDWGLAPVTRIGGDIVGNGLITHIRPNMLYGSEECGQTRWWTGCPTLKQMEDTPWISAKAAAETQPPTA